MALGASMTSGLRRFPENGAVTPHALHHLGCLTWFFKIVFSRNYCVLCAELTGGTD